MNCDGLWRKVQFNPIRKSHTSGNFTRGAAAFSSRTNRLEIPKTLPEGVITAAYPDTLVLVVAVRPTRFNKYQWRVKWNFIQAILYSYPRMSFSYNNNQNHHKNSTTNLFRQQTAA